MPEPIKKIVLFSILTSVFMFGFSFALVPLYTVLCRTTKFSSAVRIAPGKPDFKREITVEFVANNNQNLPWEFYSRTTSIQVHPNQNGKVIFHVKNLTHNTMTVQAIPSFAPGLAAKYFHKIQCFCFTQQTLKAGESMEMPVVFRIDKDLPVEVRTITLAYTLFDVRKTS